ncbi:MAG: NAD(P)-dependent oxidoreductase [Polyangiales bacterium]
MSQRVFVTGASGFLGAHLVCALSAEGFAVTALVREPSRAAHLLGLPGVSLLAGDLAHPQPWRAHLAGHDACVHLALLWGAEADDLELLDVRASARLFEAAASAGVGHLVYTSSTAVHRPWSPSMSARDATRTADYYGATKASGEAFLSAVCAARGVRGNVVRPGAVLGAPALRGAPMRLDRRLDAMIESARRGEAIRVKPGDGRQFIGAADLARLYVALLQSPCDGERFIAVAPEVISWAEVAERVCEAAGGGRVERERAELEDPPRFDVEHTERCLGAIPSARPALREALAARCAAAGHLTDP